MTAQRELSESQCQRFNAALVLLLAARVAEPAALHNCLQDARATLLPKENT